MLTSVILNLIAIAMLAMIGVTIFVVVRWHARSLNIGWAMVCGLLCGLFVFLVLSGYLIFTTHIFERAWLTYDVPFLEEPPYPWRMIILSAVCTMALCGCRANDARFRRWMIILCLACGGLLIKATQAVIYQQHAMFPLKQPQVQTVFYTMEPQLAVKVTHARLNFVRRMFSGVAIQDSNTVYPAQWFRNIVKYDVHSQSYGQGIVTTHAVWHTWLTGFYRIEEVPADFWYPGGKFKDSISRLEYRVTSHGITKYPQK